jgi:iron complex transport system ATP-binding protein
VTAAIAFAGLSVRFGTVEVVREISGEVERGEWVGLIGPNGAGKTTVLRALAGLVPYEGTVALDGHDVHASRRRDVARRVALVPQSPRIPAELTVGEYVLLGRTAHIGYLATEGRSDRVAAQRALERLELDAFAQRTLGSLSGGELQRVVLARALAQEAPLLLLDEPTSALDLGHQQQALELVDALRRDHALTVVAAMHDLTLAAQYADRLLLLDQGRIVADGSPDDVLSEERIQTHYGARVRIVREHGSVAVLPRRETAH